MTGLEWFLFFLGLQVLHFLATWKLYVRAGFKAWQAVVPVYNAVILMKIINRPWWWVILLFIPVVNLIMFIVVWVEIARSFGFNKKVHTALAVFSLGLFSAYINYFTEAPHRKDRELESENAWVPSILFAVVAATLVHTYFMQPFTIPTSSLEKTLLVGDYLFVSKFHYGARTPMTPVALPMVHDSMPAISPGGLRLTNTFKSYTKWPQLPYFRLPGLQDIKRNDIVVFSWPIDTLVVYTNAAKGVDHKPIDKKSNYVKRCVGIPGDYLSVVDGYVHIDGKQNDLPDRAKIQFAYRVKLKGQLDRRTLLRYDITDGAGMLNDDSGDFYISAASEEAIAQLKNNPSVVSVTRVNDAAGTQTARIFPPEADYGWNVDNFGPIYIPEEGVTKAITSENIALYKRLIEVYEGSDIGISNKITRNGNAVLLNGEPLTEYTFKQNYYWMMGDNRDNSLDARSWGYVPETHVVGKPVFVWMSFDPNVAGFFKSIRWERVFTTVGGSGTPKSYLIHFLVFLALYFVGQYAWKKRKAKKA